MLFSPRVILIHPSNTMRINFINFNRFLFSERDKIEITIQMWELNRSLRLVRSVVSHSNKPCVILTHPSNTMRINFWVSRKHRWAKVFRGPNTNTNIIRVPKADQIRIRILFGFPKLTEYEYEYYSGPQKRPNTNMNIIRLSKNDRIRIRIFLDSLKTQIIFFLY